MHYELSCQCANATPRLTISKKNHASMVVAAFVLRRAQLIIMREPFYIMATDLYQTKIYNKAIILFFSRGWGAEGEGMRIDPHLLN